MKTNWQIRKLGEISRIGAGNSAPQDKSFFHNGKFPFFRTSDVGEVHIGSIKSSADYLNDKGSKGLRMFPKNTILIPKSGASTFLNHRVIMEVNGYVSSHLATINTNESILDTKYLFYFLQEVRSQDLIQDHKYPSLNLPVIENIDVPVPPISEQKLIARKLDEVFERVTKAKEATEKNLQNAKDLSESYLQSVFVNQGKDWEAKRLADITEVVGGGTPDTKVKEYWGGDYYWVTPKDMGKLEGFEISKTERKISKKGLKNSSAKLLPAGSVLLSSRAPIGHVFINTVEMATNQGCRSFVCGKNILNQYLYYFLFSNKKYLNSLGSGTTFKEVSGSTLKEITIPLPPLNEQKGIAKKLHSLTTETKKLEKIYEQKLAYLEELKKSILSKAFHAELQ